MGFKTHEQIGKECRAKMRRMAARRESPCPQCKCPIAIGDTIVQPWAPDGYRRPVGNRFHGCWYCEDCGEHFQRGVDCGYLASNAPFLTIADKQAFESRPDVVEWLEEARIRRIEHVSDEQIIEEAVAAGIDVPAEAERIRRTLLTAVQEHRRKHGAA